MATKTKTKRPVTPVSLELAARQFFGLKPGQTPAQFLAEMRALDGKARADMADLLGGAGYNIEPVA